MVVDLMRTVVLKKWSEPNKSRQHARGVRGCVSVFREAICEALPLLQRRPPVAHGAQIVTLLRGSHPDDEVPALARGDGKGSVHVLAPVEEALGHLVFDLGALGFT